MKITLRRGCILALVGILLFVVVEIWRPFEPRYQGKRLTVWLDELASPPAGCPEGEYDTTARHQAEIRTNVVLSVGVAGLPYYLKWLKFTPPPSWYLGLDDWVGDVTHGHVELPLTRSRVWLAEDCFAILGPKAEPAIPELKHLLTDERHCGLAADCLAHIGPMTVPILSNTLATAQNDRVCSAAINALANLGPASKSVAPLLFEMVRKNKPFTSPPELPQRDEAVSRMDFALRALAEVETNTDVLIPLLVEHIADPNTAPGAAYGLARLGAPGIPILLQTLTNNDNVIRSAAEAALDLDFQKNNGDHGRCFQRFGCVFNLKMLNAAVYSHSKAEYQQTGRILQRYIGDTNVAVRVAAGNALEYLKLISSNDTPELHLQLPVPDSNKSTEIGKQPSHDAEISH